MAAIRPVYVRTKDVCAPPAETMAGERATLQGAGSAARARNIPDPRDRIRRSTCATRAKICASGTIDR